MTKVSKTILSGALILSLLFVFNPASAQVLQHPNGTLVSSQGTVYEVGFCGLVGFPSKQVFESYGNDFGQVVDATEADLATGFYSTARFAKGTLVAENGTVYITYGSVKNGFVSREVFEALGYSFDNVVRGDLSGYQEGEPIADASSAHGYGTLINLDGTIYQTTFPGGAKIPIPSMNVFRSHGFDLSKVVVGNAADLAAEVAPVMGFNSGTLVRIPSGGIYYLTAEGRSPLYSAEQFTGLGFDFADVLQVEETEIGHLELAGLGYPQPADCKQPLQ